MNDVGNLKNNRKVIEFRLLLRLKNVRYNFNYIL